jgi:hypothetical protein
MTHRQVNHIPRVRLADGLLVPTTWQQHGWPCATCGVIPRYVAQAYGDAWYCDQCDIYQYTSIGD